MNYVYQATLAVPSNVNSLGDNEFISPLSGDLFQIGQLIQSQLMVLQERLADRNSFIIKQTTTEYGKLIERFLVTLEHYLGSTLVDLLRLVDGIRLLMENYDYGLFHFVENFATTPQKVERFVEDAKKTVKEHAETISQLSVTSLALSDLCEKYKTESHRAASSSDKSGTISIALTFGGVAAGVGASFFFAPFIVGGAVLVISGVGGGISGLFHYYDKKKANAFKDAATEVETEKERLDSIQSSIEEVHNEMTTVESALGAVQRKTAIAVNTENERRFRLISYRMAQEEAKKAKEASIRILQFSLSIAEMKSQVAYRTKLIEKS